MRLSQQVDPHLCIGAHTAQHSQRGLKFPPQPHPKPPLVGHGVPQQWGQEVPSSAQCWARTNLAGDSGRHGTSRTINPHERMRGFWHRRNPLPSSFPHSCSPQLLHTPRNPTSKGGGGLPVREAAGRQTWLSPAKSLWCLSSGPGEKQPSSVRLKANGQALASAPAARQALCSQHGRFNPSSWTGWV